MIDTNSEKSVQSLRSGLPGEELRFLLLIMLVVLGLTPVINTTNETIVDMIGLLGSQSLVSLIGDNLWRRRTKSVMG